MAVAQLRQLHTVGTREEASAAVLALCPLRPSAHSTLFHSIYCADARCSPAFISEAGQDGAQGADGTIQQQHSTQLCTAHTFTIMGTIEQDLLYTSWHGHPQVGLILAVHPPSGSIKPAAHLATLTPSGAKRSPKIYGLAVHPYQPQLVAAATNTGTALLRLDAMPPLPAAPLPLRSPAQALGTGASRGGGSGVTYVVALGPSVVCASAAVVESPVRACSCSHAGNILGMRDGCMAVRWFATGCGACGIFWQASWLLQIGNQPCIYVCLVHEGHSQGLADPLLAEGLV